MQERLEKLLAEAVRDNVAVGAVATFGNREGVLATAAVGRRSVADDAPMTADTVFWIASMTKAITAAAAMQLVEQGRLALDSPAAEVLPELGRTQVLEGFDADGQPRLRDARRPITLRHLLTHTAGFAYNMWNADLVRFHEATGTPTITTCKLDALRTPLLRDPGEAWEYGINIDWAGRMVEAVSGQRLGEHLRAALFEPLGMRDTGFRLDASHRARLAGVHARGADGALTPIPFEVEQEPEFEMGGGGLYSTALDYLRFTRMVLNGGTLDGARVLAPATVAEMARDQLGALPMRPMVTQVAGATNDADFFPGAPQGWGLSFLVNREPSAEGRSAGGLAWAGLGNTYYWIDPGRGTTGVLLTQILPFFDPRVVGLLRAFETAMNAA